MNLAEVGVWDKRKWSKMQGDFLSLHKRERKWLSKALKLLKLILVMPATNATSERSYKHI